MGLVILGKHNTHSRTTSAWAECLCVWDDYWKLKKKQITSIDQIPVEIFKAGGRTFGCEIHKLINSIWNQEELPEEWKESSIIVHVCKKGDKRNCANYMNRGITLLSTMYKFYPTFFCQG